MKRPNKNKLHCKYLASYLAMFFCRLGVVCGFLTSALRQKFFSFRGLTFYLQAPFFLYIQDVPLNHMGALFDFELPALLAE